MENSEKRLAVAFNNDQKAYTYTTYDSLIIKQQSAIQSLFNGACFYNCEITDCNFSRSDFEGMIASQNVFINVNYSNADIKSVCWNNCKFVSCIFNDAFLDGNQFIKCSFTDCFFSRSVCENNVFKYCDFNCTIFSVSTTTLNEFYHTEFCNTDLGDCSFYKNILFGCKYKNVAINVDSLGQTFGLKQSDLKVFSYIFLGKPLGKVSEPNYTKLRESFMSKHWYYETILLDHNTNRSSNYEYIIRVTDYICNCLVEKNVIKLDELRFFILVVDFMFERQSLPLLAMVYCYNRLNEQLQLIDNEYINYKDLKNCVIKIYFLIEEMLSKFHSMQEEVILPEDYFNVSLRYDSKDLIDFAKLTNNISSLLDLKLDQNIKLSEVRQGSFIEILTTTVMGVVALQFILYGINGILLQLIDLKSKLKALIAKNPPKYISSLTAHGKQLHPDSMFKIIKNFTPEKARLLMDYAKILNNTDFKDETNNEK